LECWDDCLREQLELFVVIGAERRDGDRVGAGGSDSLLRAEDLVQRAGRGELVEKVLGKSRGDRNCVGERAEIGGSSSRSGGASWAAALPSPVTYGMIEPAWQRRSRPQAARS
jgi:hypothetical protein